MRKRAIGLAAAVAVAVGSGQFARAVDYTWDGSDSATNTNWSNALNWTADSGAPSAATDTATFDNGGVTAGTLSNTVDTSLDLAKLTYSQDNASVVGGNNDNAYTTTILRGVTLNLSANPASNTTAPANANLLVMPTTAAGASAGTGTIVKFVSDTSGTGTLGKLTITGAPGAAVNVSGRPNITTGTAFESFAILDLSELDTFQFNTAPSFTNSGFGVGSGTVTLSGTNTDTGAYSGKIILATNNFIDANRIAIGAQNNAGTAGTQPVSMLVLGQNNSINTILSDGTFSGGLSVGADPAGAKDSSGGVVFRAGLTNPTLTVGNAATGRNGFSLGFQPAQTAHFAFGVLDTTSASAGSDGTFIGAFATMNIGRHSAGVASAGGGFGMLSIDKGTIDATAMVFSEVRSAATAGSPGVAMLNVGLKGAATDAGAGVVTVSGNIALGRRNFNSNGSESNAIINIANSGSLTADRIFVGSNATANDATHTGSVIGILNLGGGTVTANRIQAGDDNPQLGTNVTRLVNFNGGTLQVKSGTTHAANFLEGMTAANVYAGGGTIDTNGESVTINQALVAPAGDGIQSITINTPGSGYRVAPIIRITGGGGVGATAVAQINADGSLAGVTVTNPGTGYTSAPTIQLVANGGTSLTNILVPFGGAAATLTPNIAANSSGGITKIGAGTLALTADSTYTGGTILNNGVLLASNTAGSATGTGNVTLTAGTLGGSGTIAGTVGGGSGAHTISPSATLAPATVAKLTVGGLTTNTNTTLAFRLVARNTPGGSDSITVTGNNALNLSGGGTLSILEHPVGPGSLGYYQAIEYTGSIPAGYTSITRPAADANKIAYTLDVAHDAGFIDIHRGFLGDADDNGTVNFADFVRLSNNYGLADKGWFGGDFNGDGTTNFADFVQLSNNYGNTVGGGSIVVSSDELAALSAFGAAAADAVPEPASLALLGIGAAALLAKRRRK
jgi:autotransporter-associated beta strand protein